MCNSGEHRNSNKKGKQGGSASLRQGGNEDTNTPMQEAVGDSEMTPSEVGIEDPYLRDIVEREGIDLPNILGQWKRKGVDNVPVEKLDHIQYLFLLREEAKSRGIKRMHGEIGHLGIKTSDRVSFLIHCIVSNISFNDMSKYGFFLRIQFIEKWISLCR
jgi:hypothetical protein